MKFVNWLNSPKTMVWIHGGFVIFWVLLWVLAAVFGWLSSVVFVSHLSAAALVLSSWACWQAARAEAKQDETE